VLVKMTPTAEVARKLRVALDLHGAGVSLMRARLRRLHPGTDESVIEQHLKTWLHSRPGAPWGDTIGSRRYG
jgi:hypothetical protein